MEMILNKVMTFLSKDNDLNEDEAEVVRYGLEIMITKIGQLDGVSRTAVSLSIKNARILLTKHLGENYINDK